MASETKRTPAVMTDAWVDLCETFNDIASVDVLIQSKGIAAAIVFGGASAPDSNTSSLALGPGESVRGNADHIWVRGRGELAIHVEG